MRAFSVFTSAVIVLGSSALAGCSDAAGVGGPGGMGAATERAIHSSSDGGSDDGAGPRRDPCAIASIERRPDWANLGLSPDGKKYVNNKKNDAGIYQIYIGDTGSAVPATSISEFGINGAPKPGAHKLMVNWHPSSKWLFVGAEMDHVRPFYMSPNQDLAIMETGANLDMYVVKPDGTAWYPLTHYDPKEPSNGGGYTGPALTPDGKHAYWAEIVSGNIFAYSFGKWRLMHADVVDDAAGVPPFANRKDVSPPATNWIEPGNVSPDGKYLLLTLDTGLAPTKPGGMDQWLLELATGRYINLNQTPEEWDEHGMFAPNSKKIVWMSSHPYPSYQASTALFGIVGIYTEFMMMDIDGSHRVQLTHFHEPGHPEYTAEDSLAAVAGFSADGSELVATQFLTGAHFPDYAVWVIHFAGRCGGDGGF